ncbi:MAG: hypothetical protein SVK08_11125 [Halobacteriota archaeon]|nr:hypothetical protein [Halobacteriota archaeon]
MKAAMIGGNVSGLRCAELLASKGVNVEENFEKPFFHTHYIRGPKPSKNSIPVLPHCTAFHPMPPINIDSYLYTNPCFFRVNS